MTIDELSKIVQSHANWINGVIANSKRISELPDATLPVNAGDYLPISQFDVTNRVQAGDLTSSQGIKYVESFTANANQTTYTVNAGVIVNDGKWTVQVGSELWNSTNGVTGMAGGNLTFNFATGEITFNIALNAGTQVIVKYN